MTAKVIKLSSQRQSLDNPAAMPHVWNPRSRLEDAIYQVMLPKCERAAFAGSFSKWLARRWHKKSFQCINHPVAVRAIGGFYPSEVAGIMTSTGLFQYLPNTERLPLFTISPMLREAVEAQLNRPSGGLRLV